MCLDLFHGKFCDIMTAVQTFCKKVLCLDNALDLIHDIYIRVWASSSHILTWICFDVVHLVEIFRDEKLLEGKQTNTSFKYLDYGLFKPDIQVFFFLCLNNQKKEPRARI